MKSVAHKTGFSVSLILGRHENRAICNQRNQTKNNFSSTSEEDGSSTHGLHIYIFTADSCRYYKLFFSFFLPEHRMMGIYDGERRNKRMKKKKRKKKIGEPLSECIKNAKHYYPKD